MNTQKQFEVTLKYTAYTNMTIEAETKEQAEQMAWDEIGRAHV